MENSNNENIDEIFEFPDNYEEIANQALFNFEKNCKFDLNKLIQKGINIDKTNINENSIEKNNLGNKKDEWEDFESDENEENEIKNNNYQVFEDENEEYEIDGPLKINQIKEFDSNENTKNKILYSKIEINKKKEKEEDDMKNKNNDIKEINIKNKEKEKENIKIKEGNINKNKKLNNKEMKDLISKINFDPPNWAINMKDEEFIKKAQKYISKNS